jgi:cardiolipin synthase
MNSSSRISSAYTQQNMVSLIRGGSEYFHLLKKMIDEAKHSIQLQVYIFDEDQTGIQVANDLINASKRGLKIQLLIDGYASGKISSLLLKNMHEHGIAFRFFEPVFKSKSYYFGRRLHHKVIVVDGQKSLVGGINISDRYNDLPDRSAWLDWAVYLEGQASLELFKLCNSLFSKSSSDDFLPEPGMEFNTYKPDHHCAVRIRRNDWVMNTHQISASYMEMLKNASKEVIIMSSYFIPGRFIRKQIERASKKGINIKIILAGLSDIGISKNAEKYFYRWALRNGLEIYEYQPNVLHGKIAVSDSSFTTIGSYNINDISALASIELNIDILNKKFSTHVHDQLTYIIQEECKQVEPMILEKETTWIRKLIQWSSYEIYRIIFTLFTFYFKKHKPDRY